jgi:fatty acid desaturase
LLAAGALVAAGHAAGSVFALAPSVIIYLAMVEVINLPHHLRLPRLAGSGEEKLSLWNQYKVSRTCVYSGWFSRLVLLNFNYHAEHHMFPTLPWHELPKAYERVRAAQPEGYQFCEGHEWIRVNRQKDLREVFAPTEILAPENESKPKAA